MYRQINDKQVRNTIDFLLNREEALNKISDSGSNRDFGVTDDSKLYFNLSTPGKFFDAPNPTPPRFNDPRGRN